MRVVPSSLSSSSSSSRKGGDSDDDDFNEKVAEVSENLTTNEEALRAKIGPVQERVKALRRTQSTPRKENFPATATAAVSVAGAAIDERRGGAATTRSGGDERREGEGQGADVEGAVDADGTGTFWEDILRASVSTLEDIFSGASSSSWDEDEDDVEEEEREETSLTVGIEKGAETVDVDGGKREKTRRDGNSSGSSNSGDIEGRKKNQDSRWEWQRQFDTPNQFMGHFKKAPAEKGEEKRLTTTAANSTTTTDSTTPLITTTTTTTTTKEEEEEEEEEDSTNAGSNWIPDASAFLSRLPLPPLIGNLFSGSSSSSTATATTFAANAAADLSIAEQSEEVSAEDDERIIDERLRDANVNAVAVANNALQKLTAAIQEIDLQIDRESPPRTPRSPSSPPPPSTAQEGGAFITAENQSEEDTFNDLKEALSEAIKNADKAKAKLGDVEVAANDVLKVRERIEKYRQSATYKKNVSLTSSENGKRGLSESQPENIQALRQALEAAQVKLKEASASSRKQTVVVARQVLVLRELFEPGAQKSAEKSNENDADTDIQREQQQEGLVETKRIDEGLYSKINSARKVAEDAIVASNITETLAKLTSWPCLLYTSPSPRDP